MTETKHKLLDPRLFAVILFVEYIHTFIDMMIFSTKSYSIYELIVIPFAISIFIGFLGTLIDNYIVKSLLESTESKMKVNVIRAMAIFMLIIFVFAGFKGVYKVESFQGAVVTKFGGQKQIMSNTGIHYAVIGFTNVEKYDLRRNYLNYPTETIQPVEGTMTQTKTVNTQLITTKDDKVVNLNAVLYYQIIDLDKWAIQTNNAEYQLYTFMESVIINEVKKVNYEQLSQETNNIEENVLTTIQSMGSDIGIKVDRFKFVKALESDEVVKAKEQAEALKISSSAKILEAENLKKATDIQKESIEDMSSDMLDYLTKMEMYKMLERSDKSVIVLPYGTGINIQGGD